jgi:hypothetical protein
VSYIGLLEDLYGIYCPDYFTPCCSCERLSRSTNFEVPLLLNEPNLVIAVKQAGISIVLKHGPRPHLLPASPSSTE